MPDELERRATAPDRALPDRALRRGWSAGDMVVRDMAARRNRGQAGQGGPLHRVLPAERTASRRTHCTTLGAPEQGL
ncbi:hypothetical protein MXD63_12660 [Frankia sp. Cpl3]|nr:hypothetical protein [Frankia sp. Cpl3]